MTLEKPLLQPARIGAGAEEARWRLALVNAIAPVWRLRGGASGGLDGSGWRRRRGAETGAPGKGRSRQGWGLTVAWGGGCGFSREKQG